MDNKFIVCPFNKSHIIHRLRIQYHIVKCKKNYPSSKKIVCPYNATEYISPDNYISHLRQCKQNKRLDVSEEFKRKQFESIPHGDASSQSFFTPNHVEVTDEWDTQSAQSENLYDDEITPDEEKVRRIITDNSKAVKIAYNYMPLVTQPIGRGKLSEVYREFLNRFEPQSKVHSSIFSPIAVSANATKTSPDENDNSIYSDADNDENIDEGNLEHSNNGYESALSNSKYYRPPISRGCHKVMSIGRGVPARRNNSDSEPPYSSSNSLDLILKNLVLNEIGVKKNKIISESSETSSCVKDSIPGVLLSDNEKKHTYKTLQDSGNQSIPYTVTSKNNKIDSCLVNKEKSISPKEIADNNTAGNKLENVYSYNDDDDQLLSNGSKYYRPSVSRGRYKYPLGRGVPIHRRSVSDDTTADYSFNSLDLILKKCISNEMSVDKSKTISKSLGSEDSIKFTLPGKKHYNYEQEDTSMNQKISNSENSSTDLLKRRASDSNSSEAVLGISSESSSPNNLTIESLIKCSKHKPTFLPEDVFECKSSKRADMNQESVKKSNQPIEIPSEPFYSIGRGKLLRNSVAISNN